MNIYFDNNSLYPIYIAITAFAIFLVGIVSRTSAPKRDWIARLFAILFVSFGILNPIVTVEHKAKEYLIYADISHSMDRDLWDRAFSKVRQQGLEVTVIPFAEHVGTGMPIEEIRSLEMMQSKYQSLGLGATNLSEVVHDATRRAIDSVLLISDGNETKGDVLSTVIKRGGINTKIYPLIVDYSKKDDTFDISSIFAKNVVNVGEKTTISAVVENKGQAARRGKLMLFSDNDLLQEQNIYVDRDSQKSFKLTADNIRSGINRYTIVLEDENGRTRAKNIYISGRKGSSILLLSGSVKDSRHLEEILKSRGYQVDGAYSSNARSKVFHPDRYSAVILNNIPVNNLPRGILTGIGSFVRAGGGLLMIGGNKSFGLGGYIETPVEELLPVRLIPPHAIQKRLSNAIVLVIDKSRSMSNEDRLVYAKEAAIAVIRELRDDDYIEVIGFDATPFVVIPMQKVGRVRHNAIDRVGRLFATGRTNLLPALHEARRGVMQVKAGKKHVIILTDGKIPHARQYYLELVREIRKHKGSVSTVLVGNEFDTEMLEEIAKAGGGSFYRASSAYDLPKIFIKDVKISINERTLREQSIYEVRVGSDGLKTVYFNRYPPLLGFTQTEERVEADTELVVRDDGRNYPLLAVWNVGKGKVIAFTSDVNGRWSSKWVGWHGFEPFWSSVIRRLTDSKRRLTEEPEFRLVTYTKNNRKVTLDLTIYDPVVYKDLSAIITKPDNSTAHINFINKAKGRFVGEMTVSLAGRYIVTITADGKEFTPVAFEISGELFGENKARGINVPLLNALAEMTGASIVTSKLPEDDIGYKKKLYHLGNYFYLLAFILFILEVLIRELSGALQLGGMRGKGARAKAG